MTHSISKNRNVAIVRGLMSRHTRYWTTPFTPSCERNLLGKELFTRYEAGSLQKEWERQVPLSKKIPSFRGRARLANLLHALYRTLRKTHSWADAPSRFGNSE